MDETISEPQGKKLTLFRATLVLIGQPFYILLMPWAGLWMFFRGSKMMAVPCCFAALSSALAMPASWKRYRLVKAGAVILLPSKAASPPVPSIIAVFVVSAWTLLVLIVAVGSAFGLLPALVSFNAGAIVIGVNLVLWYITGYLWYRVQKGWRKQPAVQPRYKQQEGVWPSAPHISENELMEIFK